MSNRQNIPLFLRSSPMTTMFTSWGHYRWTKQPFGISSASKGWQRQIHMVLDGLLGFCITEGILIPGSGASDVQSTTTASLSALLRENLLTFPVCVIRNIFIRKLSHLTISSPFILKSQKMHKNHSSF